MGLENLSAGKQVPDDINVVIEIASNSDPIKYEVDKDSGMVMVDRFVGTAMFYPCEYGFVPHTLSEDGDILGHMVQSAAMLAKQLNIADDGYRVVFNCNAGAGQSVFHIHAHLLGGRRLTWPPG